MLAVSRRAAAALAPIVLSASIVSGFGGAPSVSAAAASPERPARAPGDAPSAPAGARGEVRSQPAEQASSGDVDTGRADDERDGWYDDEPALSPETVGSSQFGQLFSTDVEGQVYAQPLLADGTLLVATEADWLYGIDPATGAIRWEEELGTPFDDLVWQCADLVPEVGVTSTPVVDPATGIAYVMAMEVQNGQPGYYLHAVDVTTGAEEPGFPVEVSGTAANDPEQQFSAYDQIQRPALLLLGGVVYAAFGGHCDQKPYQGWVVGISTAGVETTLWTDVAQGTESGGGIWQSGGGLVSDGPGRILLASGNGPVGASPSGTIPGDDPPATLSESVVRLDVEADGSLQAQDFFTPYDAADLDRHDLDFGSGAPVALPKEFSTSDHPHLLVEVGKEGYVYLLDRDDLGGVGQGPGGGDGAVDRVGPNGGVWSSPGVWPGDGGYLYIPTATGIDGSQGTLDAYRFSKAGGEASIELVGHSSQRFSLGSSSPVVSSVGTTSGSAVVWVVDFTDPSGTGAQLQAYLPVPVNGRLRLLGQWPLGLGVKYNTPLVADGRVYVGANGDVEAFGAPVSPSLSASGATFGRTVVGTTATQDLTVTAGRPVEVTGLSVNGSFSTGPTTPALPATLEAGQTLTIPVSFTPSTPGQANGTLTVAAGAATIDLPLEGLGLTEGPELTSQTKQLSLGGATIRTTVTDTLTFTNLGTDRLTFHGATTPTGPFAAHGVPPPGTRLKPGDYVTVAVSFRAKTPGHYIGLLKLDSSGGDVSVSLTAQATTPSTLEVSSRTVSYGTVPVGQAVTKRFVLHDVGGSVLTLNKSKPPVEGAFVAQSALAEGTALQPGGSIAAAVTFVPSRSGPASDRWILNSNGSGGHLIVTFEGTGSGSGDVARSPTTAGWHDNGSAVNLGTVLELTPPRPKQAGSSFWTTPMPTAHLVATFTLGTAAGSGGVGAALDFLERTSSPSSLGRAGWHLGIFPIKAWAVALSEAPLAGEPGGDFVGVTSGPDAAGTGPAWSAKARLDQPLLNEATSVVVIVAGRKMTVLVDGHLAFTTKVALPKKVLVGFSASTSTLTDEHLVEQARITASSS